MRGLVVVDASRNLSGAYCSRLLATLGADVLLLEPPGGHPLRSAPPWITVTDDGPRSAAWAYLAAGKRSAVVDLDTDPEDAALLRSTGGADVVLLSFDGDAERARTQRRAERLRAAQPALVVVVLSGFGLRGPYAGYRTTPLVDWAMGGHLLLNGEPFREPIAGAGPWSSYLGGATATIAVQAAALRSRFGGEGDLIDIGNMEAAAACHQWSITIYTHQGVRKTRWGNRHGEAHHPLALYACTDGWVVIGAVSRHQWEGLCIAADAVGLLADDALYTPAERFDRMDEIDAAINPFFAARTRAEAVQVLQEHRCPAGQVLNLAETLRSPQLEARGFWAVPDGLGPGARLPGPPFRLNDRRVELGPAPQLGAHQEVLAR